MAEAASLTGPALVFSWNAGPQLWVLPVVRGNRPRTLVSVIGSASELWRRWVDGNILRPRDYDTDIAELVQAALPGPGTGLEGIPDRMDAAGWGARDLIRTLLPALTSFSGMLTDLLGLYERVGATTAGGSNLRIHYEFEDGVTTDEQLSDFRETVERVETVMSAVDAFAFEFTHAWASPMRGNYRLAGTAVGPVDAGAGILGYLDCADVPFTAEVPVPTTTDPSILKVVIQHHQVIVAALARLAALAGSERELAAGSRDLESTDDELLRSANDNWWLMEIAYLHSFPDVVGSLASPDRDRLLAGQEEWLKGFWRTAAMPVDQQVTELTDILSLPQWGRRFELYSAWVVAAMDAALGAGRLVFDVTDGVLAFPFRANLLARVATAFGPVELWSEKRFTAADLVGKGRTNGIQPDFTLIDSATSSVRAAVEAKQYRSRYSKNPGQAARDYARNLPAAEVLVVAHGPIRENSHALVEPMDRDRVQFHHDVRPGSVAALRKLSSCLKRILPPPPDPGPGYRNRQLVKGGSQAVDRGGGLRGAGAGTVVLRWAAEVRDLDLHLVDELRGTRVSWASRHADHATLSGDAFYGGPESAVLHADGDVVIEVHLYSGESPSVEAAAPVVTITTLEGVVVLTPPAGLIDSVWRVAVVHPNGMVSEPQ